MDARRLVILATLTACPLAASCTAPALRSQSPEEFSEAIESRTRLVGEYAQPYGNNYVKVESVALITGLANTGEDPAPSPQREILMNEMKRRGVVNPTALLASPTTALVVVRGFLPPGALKGDHIDLETQTLNGSETESLRGGWLMECDLHEIAALGDGGVHKGHKLALGEGPVLVDPAAEDGKDRGLLTRGRILGGGVVLKNRSLGLVIGADDKSVRLSAQIADAIGKRFNIFEHGVKRGVAKAKTDEFIDLAVHPRYKNNIARYLRVVRAAPIKESTSDQFSRLELLERQLLDPITSSTAALRLEAIGLAAVPTLLKGIDAKEAEVRFYAAEALAYLDQTSAVEPLGRAAREEPAFRVYALTALSAMDDMTAYDELRSMLEASSAETRYGAFRALWAMNASDPIVKGENMGGRFSFHVLNTSGPPMIHVTRSFRPEIVMFGADQRFSTPMVIEAGRSIIVRADDDDRVTVSRFLVGQPDEKRVVSARVDDVVRAIVELGGAYPDVVLALQQAKNCHALPSRLEVDALPDGGRAYKHKESEEKAAEPLGTTNPVEVASPLPELFLPKALRGLR